jgi:hypothetical protein
MTNNFDYDKLFYENIEYFLQEYEAWEKVTTAGGFPNAFDAENYLRFTLDDTSTFESSQDDFGTQIASIDWSYVGGYEVFDITGYEDLKILTLTYEGGDIEEFELSVLNDGRISLFNVDSETTYDFLGREFTLLLKGEKIKTAAKDIVGNSNRKRTKINRNTKERKSLK